MLDLWRDRARPVGRHSCFVAKWRSATSQSGKGKAGDVWRVFRRTGEPTPPEDTQDADADTLPPDVDAEEEGGSGPSGKQKSAEPSEMAKAELDAEAPPTPTPSETEQAPDPPGA